MQDGLPQRVALVEVGPRDGLQNEAVPVSTGDKVELICRLVDAGLRRIEATSFVNPARVPQMADAEAVMARVPRPEGVSYSGLVLNPRGAERAFAAGCHEITYVIVASETFSQRNQGRGIEATLQEWAAVAALARRAGVQANGIVAAAFGCPFEGRIDAERVAGIAARLAATGADEICLADTIGVGSPRQVLDLAGRVRPRIGALPLRFHFHNTRNTGYANAYAALLAGANALDASVGGIGGCPFAPRATGNIATEDLCYLLDELGVGHDGRIEALMELDGWLAERLGHAVPGQLGKAGPFQHRAQYGIQRTCPSSDTIGCGQLSEP
jgi:hydroxymethylglutaryl-CoA lyase